MMPTLLTPNSERREGTDELRTSHKFISKSNQTTPISRSYTVTSCNFLCIASRKKVRLGKRADKWSGAVLGHTLWNSPTVQQQADSDQSVGAGVSILQPSLGIEPSVVEMGRSALGWDRGSLANPFFSSFHATSIVSGHDLKWNPWSRAQDHSFQPLTIPSTPKQPRRSLPAPDRRHNVVTSLNHLFSINSLFRPMKKLHSTAMPRSLVSLGLLWPFWHLRHFGMFGKAVSCILVRPTPATIINCVPEVTFTRKMAVADPLFPLAVFSLFCDQREMFLKFEVEFSSLPRLTTEQIDCTQESCGVNPDPAEKQG